MSIKITSSEIKKLVDAILTYQKTMERVSFEIDVDYYWHINSEARHNPLEDVEMKNMTLGQLSADLENLKEILEGDHDGIAYSFVWLGYILIAIGEKYIS